ncbi:ribonuclease HII [Helicosporidium sp. ATCC 50920]|nr:ribonuclease HII [Helicosporidium sp. ATCC 50920]|eukprot:KDD73986.1 ribonuclease HII [Helicosporidium sp. ATCC 50920]
MGLRRSGRLSSQAGESPALRAVQAPSLGAASKRLGVRKSALPVACAAQALAENVDPGLPAAKDRKAPAGASREMENQLRAKGFANVAGVDEAGRGPLAGPVVAAACVISPHVDIPGVADSKIMTEEQREAAFQLLTTTPGVVWATCVIGEKEIDTINILQAALKAMVGATEALPSKADYVLALDPARSKCVVKGDSKVYAIAAASIIAKVTRDRIMLRYAEEYPGYGFEQHKGYGVPAHVKAIRDLGPSPIHRRTFAPVKTWFPAGKAAPKERK